VAILDFVVAYDLVIVNSHFKKKGNLLVTFWSGISETQIDYVLIMANNKRLCKDCKVIVTESLGTQHKLLVMNLVIKMKKTRISDPRIRWLNLT